MNSTEVTTTAVVAQNDRFCVGRNKNLRDNITDDDLLSQLASAVAADQRDAVFDLAAKLVTARNGLPVSTQSTAVNSDKLPIREVAKQLTCGTRTVWRLVARGDLRPPVHVGGSARWLRCDVQEYSDRISKHRR